MLGGLLTHRTELASRRRICAPRSRSLTALGHFSEVALHSREVRFTPVIGHLQTNAACPFRANCGLK
jgi:hypothetical protein